MKIYFQNYIFIFQLNTITSGRLTAVPAVAAADCPFAGAAPTNAELLACVNALRTDVNTNIITAINNAYGNPTCTKIIIRRFF